jgi:hypothetical protein
MGKVFSVDVKVWATAYVHADSGEQAVKKLQKLRQACVRLDDADEVEINDSPFDDPELPELSLSPLATVDGESIDLIEPDELECVHDDEEKED